MTISVKTRLSVPSLPMEAVIDKEDVVEDGELMNADLDEVSAGALDGMSRLIQVTQMKSQGRD